MKTNQLEAARRNYQGFITCQKGADVTQELLDDLEIVRDDKDAYVQTLLHHGVIAELVHPQ